MALMNRAGEAAPTVRAVFVRHAAAWLYLVGVCLAELGYVLLPPPDRAALLRWASTSVQNLTHHPVASLIASAFFPTTFLPAWPVLIALALFGATSAIGNWRTAVTCAAGQVVGTLVSEGIVAYRISAGSLPDADRFLLDVGPSYVVVAAIAVGLLHGGWLVRAAAAVDFALLIFVGQIFAGLSRLEVAPVGHLTALITGVVVGTALARRYTANSPGHY
jgi:Rhomboid-like protein